MRLRDSLKRVNQQYFGFEELPEVLISKGQIKENRRAIVFGTYNIRDNKIKIHPVLLDQEDFVLDFVVYHELLHYQDRHLLKKRKKGNPIHTREFRSREKSFQQYYEAQKILKDILYSMDKKEPPNKVIKKTRLTGEALEIALAESLKNLDRVLQKYQTEDEPKKGAKRGAKKRNEETELVDNH
ncbi:MAG: SprT-like domain-containing protein, partial [Brevinema sp.]